MRSKLEIQDKQRRKFLPMLCSSFSSTKEVHLSHHRRCSSSSSSASVSDDPSSPRVGCMGQVKKHNKVAGLPNIISSGPNNLKSDHHHSTANIVKYHKLRSCFSSMSLINSPTTTTIVAATTTTRTGTHKRNNAGNRTARVDYRHGSTRKNASADEKDCCSLVNLVELDPPLPVVKQVQKQEEGNNNIDNNGEKINLWKRRSGGAPLKSLQLQIHAQPINQNCTLLSANTV